MSAAAPAIPRPPAGAWGEWHAVIADDGVAVLRREHWHGDVQEVVHHGTEGTTEVIGARLLGFGQEDLARVIAAVMGGTKPRYRVQYVTDEHGVVYDHGLETGLRGDLVPHLYTYPGIEAAKAAADRLRAKGRRAVEIVLPYEACQEHTGKDHQGLRDSILDAVDDLLTDAGVPEP